MKSKMTVRTPAAKQSATATKGAAKTSAKKRSAPARAIRKAAPKARATSVKAKSPAGKAKDGTESWNLRLYVAGQTPRSVTAFSNLKRLCEERLAGRYMIEVIDLVKQPQLAQGDQIIAIPTLVRKLPEPIKRVVGDLSNIERVLVGMDLQAAI